MSWGEHWPTQSQMWEWTQETGSFADIVERVRTGRYHLVRYQGKTYWNSEDLIHLNSEPHAGFSASSDGLFRWSKQVDLADMAHYFRLNQLIGRLDGIVVTLVGMEGDSCWVESLATHPLLEEYDDFDPRVRHSSGKVPFERLTDVRAEFTTFDYVIARRAFARLIEQTAEWHEGIVLTWEAAADLPLIDGLDLVPGWELYAPGYEWARAVVYRQGNGFHYYVNTLSPNPQPSTWAHFVASDEEVARSKALELLLIAVRRWTVYTGDLYLEEAKTFNVTVTRNVLRGMLLKRDGKYFAWAYDNGARWEYATGHFAGVFDNVEAGASAVQDLWRQLGWTRPPFY